MGRGVGREEGCGFVASAGVESGGESIVPQEVARLDEFQSQKKWQFPLRWKFEEKKSKKNGLGQESLEQEIYGNKVSGESVAGKSSGGPSRPENAVRTVKWGDGETRWDPTITYKREEEPTGAPIELK